MKVSAWCIALHLSSLLSSPTGDTDMLVRLDDNRLGALSNIGRDPGVSQDRVEALTILGIGANPPLVRHQTSVNQIGRVEQLLLTRSPPTLLIGGQDPVG